MWSGAGQVVPSVQIVVQRALTVAAKQSCHLHFMEKVFIRLIAGLFDPVSGCEISSAVSGLSHENRVGWSP
jgi:hypothetical protein